MEELKLYDRLKGFDILVPEIERLLRQGSMVVKGGRIKYAVTSEIQLDNYWLFSKRSGERKCEFWMNIYFQKYHIISRGCFNCWKVVVRPRTLKELFEIRKLQLKLGFPGKCGVDDRVSSKHKGEYAAFWYCPYSGGLEAAKEHHKVIERAVHEAVGFQTPVILKRACTEMEDAAGPTNNWAYPERQHVLEDILDQTFVFEYQPPTQPWFHIVHTMTKWIEQALLVRDPTVGEFFDLKQIWAFNRATPTVTYHDKIQEIRQPKVEVSDAEKRISEVPELQRLSDYIGWSDDC